MWDERWWLVFLSASDSDVSFHSHNFSFSFAFNLLSADKIPSPILIKPTLRQSFTSLYFFSFTLLSLIHWVLASHQHEYVPNSMPPRPGLCLFLLNQPWWPLLCQKHGQFLTLILSSFSFSLQLLLSCFEKLFAKTCCFGLFHQTCVGSGCWVGVAFGVCWGLLFESPKFCVGRRWG